MPRKAHCYFYIYKTTNLLNSQFYIGMHCTSDLNDGYLGSGLRLRRSIRKYGKQNFKKEILEFCSDRDSLVKREREIVNSDLIKEDLCMNLKLGGSGGFTNEEHRKKFFEAAKLVGFTNKEILKKSNAARKWLLENDLNWKLNRSKKISKNLILYIKTNGHNCKGLRHTEETKLKMSLSNNHQKGEKNSQFDTCWIYNFDLNQNKKIQKSELQNYLNQNWLKGRKIKF